MKKFLPLSVCGIIILSSLGALVIGQPTRQNHLTEQHVFSEPIIREEETTSSVQFEQIDTYLMNTGQPVLPYKTLTYTFPAGTKITKISCTPSNVHQKELANPIRRASPPRSDTTMVTRQTKTTTVTSKTATTSITTETYPEQWYSTHIGYGRKNDELYVIVTINLFPVHYASLSQNITYAEKLDVEITYEKPTSPLTLPDEYDLLIVSPASFEGTLQPLVEHKDNHGVDTLLVTIEDILENSEQGRDDAEKLKYFIKDTLEESGITYVLLVGGRKPHWKEQWYVPTRYSLLDDGQESSYLSDLYFSDIYKYEEGEPVFDTWDSNENDMFAEWRMMGKDHLDLYPDVYVGRWACRNKLEVRVMVRKTIAYEQNSFSGFENFALIGGDSYDDQYDFIEGELATFEAYKQVSHRFDAVKLWASEVDLNARNIRGAFEQGAGFAYFCGHGNPMSWATHEPNNFDEWEDGLLVFDMPFINNGNKLPVVVIGGCHNSQFNVTIFNSFSKEKIWKGENSPECWSWWLTRKINGGAIATIGNTGLGYHGDGDSDNDGIADYIQILDGWLEINFFRLFSERIDNLGELHSQTLHEYITTFPGNDHMPLEDRMDCKMVQQWCLLGDPSLKIGGYHSGT